MLANYEKFGFKIKAEHLPESCTWCPFWTAPMADVEFAGCYITGSEVRLDTGDAMFITNDMHMDDEAAE